MKLNVARLCLNCEEVHAAKSCPRCASDTFTYLTRWVPRIETPAPEPPSIAKPNWVQRVVFGGGAISLVAYVGMRWWQKAQNQVEVVSFRKAGELR
jgi:hypothetical protein